MRNRRYTMRRGPLIVYEKNEGIVRAFRNLPGVELCRVDRLSVLQLAPGGHVGRFVVWTKSAFSALDSLYGTHTNGSELKKGYNLPQHKVFNGDLHRIINSDEVQAVLRPIIRQTKKAPIKRNPLRNRSEMAKLNPFFNSQRRALRSAAKRAEKKAEKITHARKKTNRENFVHVTGLSI